MHRPFLLASQLAFTMVAACSDSSESWHQTLTPGTYAISGPTCLSTGESPLYPSVRYAAALFDFDDLEERTLTFQGIHAKEVFKTTACVVSIERKISKNLDGFFSLQRYRTFRFDPLECRPKVTVGDVTVDLGPEFSDLYGDSQEAQEDLLYVVTHEGDKIQLTSIDLADVNEIWQNYGCANPDRLLLQANRKTSK